MSIINYHDPTVININLDDNGNPVSTPIENETKQIADGKIPLEGLPDEQYRIQIMGYVEIDIKDKIDSPDKFKCDYTHGILYFDQSLNGTNININKYYSRGQFYTPANRVWTKLGSSGEVLETLDQALETVNAIAGDIENIANVANEAITVKNDLIQAISNANTVNTNLANNIANVDTKIIELNNAISNADGIVNGINTSIDSANIAKNNLDNTISNANIIKGQLDTTSENANILKSEIESLISTGTTLNNSLENNIQSGNTLLSQLTNIISDANTSKTNLDASVVTANTSKDSLDGSISTANTTKGNLDNSISNAATKKGELDSSVVDANMINDTLSNATDGTIKKATDINNTLNSTINTANASKSNLDASVDSSTTAKINLDNSVSIANTTKTALDGSIAEGSMLKGELGQIIAGTDYEQLITDLDSLKQDQHIHTNKDTLDGLSDVDGRLKYNGQDIGIGDMRKEDYDTNNNGKVDIAENAERLGGQLPSYYAKAADIPDISGKADISYVDSELSKKVDNTRVLTDVPKDAKFTDTTYDAATTTVDGLMSSSDKTKLNGIEAGANKTVINNTLASTSTTQALSANQGRVLNGKISTLNEELSNLEYSELSSTATNVDSEGVYRNIEWKRKDGALYAKSSLMGTYPYSQIKIDYYNELGTTIIKTIVWDLTYDENEFPYQRVVI